MCYETATTPRPVTFQNKNTHKKRRGKTNILKLSFSHLFLYLFCFGLEKTNKILNIIFLFFRLSLLRDLWRWSIVWCWYTFFYCSSERAWATRWSKGVVFIRMGKGWTGCTLLRSHVAFTRCARPVDAKTFIYFFLFFLFPSGRKTKLTVKKSAFFFFFKERKCAKAFMARTNMPSHAKQYRTHPNDINTRIR